MPPLVPGVRVPFELGQRVREAVTGEDTIGADATDPRDAPSARGGTIGDDSTASQLFSPSLFLESASFGFVDDRTLESAGIDRTFSTDDLPHPYDDETTTRNQAAGDKLQAVAYVAGFAVLAFAVGQLFTFEIGS